MHIAQEKARLGDLDGAIELGRNVIDHLFTSGGADLDCAGDGCAGGVTAAIVAPRQTCGKREAAIDRLAAAPTEPGLVLHDIWLLRLRALLARAHGDDSRLPRLPGSLPRHGENAWLRGAYRLGRGDAMTAPGLVCGPCGTELPPNAKSYNESAVPGRNGNASRSPLVVPAVTGLGDLRLTHESTRRG